jgi:hypothetical protein
MTDEKEFSVSVVDESVPFPVLRIELPFNDPPVIVVQASAGRSYLLQFKDRLDAKEWSDLYALVATSSELRFIDFGFRGSPQRFYRVLLLLE